MLMLLLLFIRCREACNRSADDLLIWIKNGYDGSVRPNSTGKNCYVKVTVKKKVIKRKKNNNNKIPLFRNGCI